MNIAITGSSGFIGKSLINTIKDLNPLDKVILVDKLNGIDILNKNQLNTIDNFEIMVHLAAKSYIPTSFENPFDYYFTNILGTLNILELCKINKSKLIYVSSYVYGCPEYIPVDENHITKAFNPYGQSKLICESLCEGYNRDFGIPTIIFRPFNVYGDGQNVEFLISSIFQQIKEGKNEITLKNPNPKRDFIYLSDVISAIIKAIKINCNTIKVLNICSGESYSVKEVTQIINSLLKKKINFVFETKSNRKNEVNDTRGNNENICKFLEWKPLYSLEQGLKLMVESYNL